MKYQSCISDLTPALKHLWKYKILSVFFFSFLLPFFKKLVCCCITVSSPALSLGVTLEESQTRRKNPKAIGGDRLASPATMLDLQTYRLSLSFVRNWLAGSRWRKCSKAKTPTGQIKHICTRKCLLHIVFQNENAVVTYISTPIQSKIMSSYYITTKLPQYLDNKKNSR